MNASDPRLADALDDLKEAEKDIDAAEEKLEEMAAEAKEEQEGEVELHKLCEQLNGTEERRENA